MGCMDKNFCPAFFINRLVDWNIVDPRGKPIEKIREIRDIIEGRVKEIVQEIGKDNKD